MKASAQQVAGILADPSRLCGILVYGDDWGLVRARAVAATEAVIGAGADAFRLSVLGKEDHGRLRGEVGSLSLGGGRRVVRVQEATDALAPALSKLGDHRADTLVVVEAAGLTPRSKLRAFAEKEAAWAAVACFPERAAAIASEITRTLAAAGLRVVPEAVAFLTAELAGESVRRSAELEKLVVYASGTGVVTLEAAQACCVAELDASLAVAVSACLSGQVARCDALLQELGAEGATGPGLLAVLSIQVQRLLRLRAHMSEGRPAEDAARALVPPVFAHQLPALLAEAERWSVAALLALGRAIRDADLACKRAGSADLAIASRLLHAAAARRSTGERG